MTPNSNMRECVTPSCENGQIISLAGECSACGDYMTPTDNMRECVTPSCENGQIISPAGECSTCGDYQTPNSNMIECVTPSCENGQIISPAGECETCPEDWKPDYFKTTCLLWNTSELRAAGKACENVVMSSWAIAPTLSDCLSHVETFSGCVGKDYFTWDTEVTECTCCNNNAYALTNTDDGFPSSNIYERV